MSREPGLDRHEWESEWEALAPEVEDSPADALPELHGLVERMLVERGFAVDEQVADDGDDPEILAEFRAARDVTLLLERGEQVGPGDVAAAVNGYRAVYDYLLEERSGP
jgi:hypothetical protein